MKRIFTILAVGAAILYAEGAQAQSFGDLLKGLSSLFGTSTPAEQPQQPQLTFPGEEELKGTWIYSQPEVVYEGNDALASLAISSVKGQLPSLATKYGVTAGKDYAMVKDAKIIIVRGEKKSALKYEYTPSTGKVLLTGELNKKKVQISATVTTKDDSITMLFDASEVVAIAAQTKKYKENSALQMMGSVITSYPGIKVGITAKRPK